MRPYLDTQFGNPSSSHQYATGPADTLATARAHRVHRLRIRGRQPCHPRRRPHRHVHGRRHLITQATEHPAVLATCHALHRLHGVEVTVLPVDGQGLLDPTDPTI